MTVLVAGNNDSILLLQSLLTTWGYDIIPARSGEEAWQILSEPEHPHLLLLDGMITGIACSEIVQRLREREPEKTYHTIVITRDTTDAVAAALATGADDFVGSPLDTDELRARVAIGYRVISLQKALDRTITKRKQAEKELRAEKQKLMKTLTISDNYQAQLQELNSRIKGMAQMEERSRLYRDLHDGAGQSLQAVCLHLKMLADGKGGYDDPKPLAAQLAREVADVASELRDIAHQLRPSYLHEITLDAAVASRCETLSRRGVPITVTSSGDFTTLPHLISDNIYRISQEAIANAARHAGAGQITVNLERTGNGLRLAITDDGCGISDVPRNHEGMGLRIIRERATLIGATLDISSSPSGTKISVTLP